MRSVAQQPNAAEADDLQNLDKQSHSNFDTQAPAREVIEQK